MAAKPKKITDLPNLGKASANMLASAGIETPEQLAKLGSIASFIAVKSACINEQKSIPSLNLLWAIEGALTDRHWQDIAKNERTSLLLAIEDYENCSK